MGFAAVRSALAARLAATSAAAVYARPPEVPAASPALVIGAITWTVVAGEREVTRSEIALEVWVERTDTDDAAIGAAEALVDEIRAALAASVSLGGAVSHAFVTGGTGNDWRLVGASEWLVVTLTVEVVERITRGYSP